MSRSRSPRRDVGWTVVVALVATAVLAGAASAATGDPVPADETADPTAPEPSVSIALAYEFLDARTDQFCDGEGMCLPRSYEGGFFTTPTWDFTPSFVYDDALVIIAYTARGLPDDIRRAKSIGETLLFVQANDPIGDGRVRTHYEPHAIRQGRMEITGPGTFTGNQAWAGLALARQIAHTTYRSALEFDERFGRIPQGGDDPMHGGRFAVQSYLDHHASKLARRFDANSYVVLTESMLTHDLGRDRGGVTTALQSIRARVLVVGVDTDRLFLPAESERIAREAPHAEPVRLLRSAYGHDGFLIEFDQLGPIVGEFLAGVHKRR